MGVVNLRHIGVASLIAGPELEGYFVGAANRWLKYLLNYTPPAPTTTQMWLVGNDSTSPVWNDKAAFARFNVRTQECPTPFISKVSPSPIPVSPSEVLTGTFEVRGANLGGSENNTTSSLDEVLRERQALVRQSGLHEARFAVASAELSRGNPLLALGNLNEARRRLGMQTIEAQTPSIPDPRLVVAGLP